MKESRNASDLLPIKLAVLISDLDLFAIVSGHVCADVTLTSRDALEEDGKALVLSTSCVRTGAELRRLITWRWVCERHMRSMRAGTVRCDEVYKGRVYKKGRKEYDQFVYDTSSIAPERQLAACAAPC